MSFFRGAMGAALCSVLWVWPTLASAEVYEPYGQLLSDHLIEKNLPGNGLVSAFDYRAALDDPGTDERLTSQRKTLAEFDPSTLDDRDQSVAFWINAYNFFMLEQILTERPDGQLVDSVWDYGGRLNPFVDSVFDRRNFTVGGEQYSLNDIEKGILLGEDYQAKGWKDARVHFAVNCASVGCPPLRQQVYTADNLESLLAENTRRAFNTDRHLNIDGGTIYVTELFNWYQDDFVSAAGSVQAYIREWASSSVADKITAQRDIKYVDYDWALNSPVNFSDVSW